MFSSNIFTLSDFLFIFVSDLNVVVYENEINEFFDRHVLFEGRSSSLRLDKSLCSREIFQVQYTNDCLFIFLI